MHHPLASSAVCASLKALATQLERVEARLEALEGQQAARQRSLVEMLETLVGHHEELRLALEVVQPDPVERRRLPGSGARPPDRGR